MKLRSLIFTCLVAFFNLAISQVANLENAHNLFDSHNYEQALTEYEQAIAEYKNYSLPYFACRVGQSKCYIQMSKNDQAIEVLESAIDELDTLDSDEKHEIAEQLYLYLGISYLNTADYEQALFFLEKESEYIQDYKSEKMAFSLVEKGICHWQLGEDEKAHYLLDQALTIRKDIGDKNKIASSYNDLGLIYSEYDQTKALGFYNKGASIFKDIDNEESYFNTLYNIAIAQHNLKNYMLALDNFSKVLVDWEKRYGKEHVKIAHIKTSIARSSIQLNQMEYATLELDEALAILQNKFGNNHPDISAVYLEKCGMHLNKKEYNEAAILVQKAIQSNCPDYENTDLRSNPTLENTPLNTKLLITALELKARVYGERFSNKTLKLRDLTTSQDVLELCIAVVEEYRHTLKSGRDKILLAQKSSDLFDALISTNLLLADVTLGKKKYYQHKAFEYCQKSKSAVLSEAIQDTKAKKFSGVPEAKIEEERELLTNIQRLELELSKTYDKDLQLEFRQQIISSKQKLESFVAILEKEYPKYFALKYSVKTPTVSDIQAELKLNELYRSYFINESSNSLVIFSIDKKKLKISVNPLPKELDKLITGVRNGIVFQANEVFLPSCTELSKYLFPDKISKNISHLIIEPDGRLAIVPFDALMNQESEYLVNNYAFSNINSASLFLDIHSRSQSSYQNATLLAPVTFDYSFKRIASLPGTLKETQSIDSLFRLFKISTELVTHEKASETYIKNTENSQGILHLATHGMVEEKHPEKSRIFLQEDEQNDGLIYTGDIYQLALPYDLVTLSACETGLGQITKGEGVIGLNRALSYAGAKNIISSYWKVDDQATALLMIKFYSNLLEGQNISQALQGAKQSLLQSNNYKHPYYWASFALTGL